LQFTDTENITNGIKGQKDTANALNKAVEKKRETLHYITRHTRQCMHIRTTHTYIRLHVLLRDMRHTASYYNHMMESPHSLSYLHLNFILRSATRFGDCRHDWKVDIVVDDAEVIVVPFERDSAASHIESESEAVAVFDARSAKVL